MIDYYEFLQISPHADSETIHRVYRFLATRYHPDHPQSGNSNMFHLLKTAYDVLSDPDQRAEYDLARKQETVDYEPLSSSVDFMDSLDGELNRRLAVLAVLYHRRRTNPDMPEVPLDEIETRMGFPRDYLDFTLWYLSKKGYITRGDSALFALTANGVDFVETQRGSIPVLNKMLTTGSESPGPESAQNPTRRRVPEAAPVIGPRSPKAPQARPSRTPIVLPSEMDSDADQRTGLPDRRTNQVDRRVNPRGRRSTD
jgi:curved DNA-binding protein CbpA